MAFADYFSVQVFFLVFRETLETAVIVSVLLTFLRRSFGNANVLDAKNAKLYNSLFWQVWAGAGLGLLVCVIVGAAFMAAFYYLGTNIWSKTEKLWEAFFCVLASILITFMGVKMLRINKLKTKWRIKLAQAIVDSQDTQIQLADGTIKRNKKWLHLFSNSSSLALLPFVTTMREGLEAVAFLGGLGVSQPGTSFPLAVVAAIALGAIIGVAMYQYGTHTSIRVFLIASTCFLYLVAAGLMSRGVWFYEMHQFIRRVGQDVSESGSGPGSYNVRNTVWHVNCCNPETDGFWMVFNGLLGWQNSATYGSLISYNLYWIFIMFMIVHLHRKEKAGLNKINDQEDVHLIDEATNAIRGSRTAEDREASIDSTTPLYAG